MEKNIILFENFGLIQDPIHSEIGIKSLHVIIQFQMFHWQAITMKEHKIFDDFITDFKEMSDNLIEVISGVYGRIQLPNDLNIPLRNIIDLCPIGFIEQTIYFYDVYKNNAVKDYSEIVSIIDDILALFQKTKYLLSFS